MKRLRLWWATIYLWLTRVEPTSVLPQGSRDRELHGKARRNARQGR